MATLYELVPAYQSVMSELEDCFDDHDKQQMLLDTLDSINCAIEVKADGYAKMMRMLNDTDGMKAEIDRLTKRKKAQENLAAKLKERLQYAMELIGKDKIKTDLFTISIQNHKPSVDVHTPELLPNNFKRITVTEDYDKNMIYKAIQQGEVVPGACLMVNKGVVIR